ncbi:sensor histidine kinase [Clostridium tarantellae]|uniref:histidine kinase n=1 Tax=Clostridium tarantellae TaxID=39493 RepID=A0A6I1MS35_9CLOT|nr:sensor histidine kinase [Clostridium tarantellae]MPQ45002.1 sensor histidine kinase [Clostridium tarantellae]
MSFKDYIKDRYILILVNIIMFFISSIFFILINVNIALVLTIMSIWIIALSIVILLDWIKKYKFYSGLLEKLENIDKKYMIPSVIEEPDFIEGKILFDVINEGEKSMHEEVKKYRLSQEEYREYIEMWIHEIKTPISSSKLIIENNKNEVTLNLLEELEKLEDFIEQVLYYSRSNTVEKDYIVKEFSLINSVNKVIKKNRKAIRNKRIKIDIEEFNTTVFSDTKWIEFILNQIIANSIKYSKGINDCIKIYTIQKENNTMLIIKDKGIGIKKEDLPRVFDKGFTGINGRNNEKSTGMGLYIINKLCKKLSIGINISSKVNEGTEVSLIFPKSKMILLEN